MIPDILLCKVGRHDWTTVPLDRPYVHPGTHIRYCLRCDRKAQLVGPTPPFRGHSSPSTTASGSQYEPSTETGSVSFGESLPGWAPDLDARTSLSQADAEYVSGSAARRRASR